MENNLSQNNKESTFNLNIEESHNNDIYPDFTEIEKDEVENADINSEINANININDNSKIFCDKIICDSNNEIIYNEIFFDGNSDCYDMILSFESFEQLKKDGWNAYFSPQGWEKYLESIEEENIIIGVVGIKNRGKSYLLKRIMNNEYNYQANDGFLVSTYGISCGFPVLKDKNALQTFVTLDSAGRDNPLLQNVFSEEKDIKTIIKDQKVCEILLSDFIFQECNVLIAVVEQLSFAEQEMIITLINRLKLKEVYNNIERRKLIIIHNLMNISKSKDIDKFVKNTLLKSMTFSLEPQFVEDHEDEKYNLTVYNQKIENNDNDKLEIVHLVIGNDKVEEIRTKYNEPVFKYIRDYIKIGDLRKFDILNSFKDFIKTSYHKFINTNIFDDNPLKLGEKKDVKVYTDKKLENIADKVLVPIGVENKEKIKDFVFKNFFFSDGIYHSAEPLYSAKVIEYEKRPYLEILVEMSGILKAFNTYVTYDDNNNKIIIEIRGKIEEYELDFLKQEEKTKSNENAKQSEFDLQLILDKFNTIKNKEVEIENSNVKDIFEDDTGICTFLFPINIYET